MEASQISFIVSCDYFLWDHLKSKVHHLRTAETEQLNKTNIQNAIAKIPFVVEVLLKS